MSAFEVVLTPTRAKNKKRVESREPTDVMMAPFSAKAIVEFEDVPVGKTAKRILRVINPTEDDIEVNVVKAVAAEYNVTINWRTMVIPAIDEVEMEMIWSPQYEIICKETLSLLDNRNFRKDIMIIMKTRSNKPLKGVRKYPSVSANSNSYIRRLRLKSPTGPSKTQKSSTQPRKSNQCIKKLSKPSTISSSIHIRTPPKSVWANRKESPRKMIQEMTINITHTSPLMERNTYCYDKYASQAFTSPVLHSVNDVHKENVSPLTPNNVIKLIDNITFTPVASTSTGVGKNLNNLDNLASWPTPNTTDFLEVNLSSIQPRRLKTVVTSNAENEVASEITFEMRKDSSDKTIITNKTFEVRHETADISYDTLDASLSSGFCLNRTTTITTTPKCRPLTIIQEEEINTSTNPEEKITQNQKTFTKSFKGTIDRNKSNTTSPTDANVLKRDIKLIGTPLRKYSESMKDLSIKSPNSKLSASQGSMPNLNEMECIRSIEQNRYFYSKDSSKMADIQEQTVSRIELQNCDASINMLNCGDVNTIANLEVAFNQNEILAQSSRCNLNEVGLRSHKKSPIAISGKWRDLRGVSPKSRKSQYCLQQSTPMLNTQKRNMHELSFSDARSSESLVSDHATAKRTTITAVNSSSSIVVSPPKRQRFNNDNTFEKFTIPNLTNSKNWSRVQVKKLKLIKTVIPQKMASVKTSFSTRSEKLYDPELYLQFSINPDPFAASTTCDPFLASTMYLDEQAVGKHQQDFKKWLNALVTIPADMDASNENKVDLGKLFNEVRHKDLTLAPTKEEQSMDYLVQHRLETVRRAAIQLYLSDELRVPCTKVAVYVNKNAIRIRNDRNLHLDVVMQRYILELLLYFNPLWLRMGLEVVYGQKIYLRSNNDVIGLSTFILNRLFRDKFLEEKYSRAYSLSEEYADYVKKHTLTKMLCLLLFLDKAKNKNIIKYNPCLFLKKSPYKETKEILLKFSSELLANMGDITRDLKRLGYKLEHKQEFLDEFDYAFHNLAVDLRDGIRLTRVMEIILLREGLSNQLRVPAISRLQRIYNVNLALRALSEADFELKGNIAAADIVDGHREKTLSLLWQIIYKFRAPKFNAAACVLQKWWRHKWLGVCILRRIRQKEEQRRQLAATILQAFYRGYSTRRWVHIYRKERNLAALILQKHIRRYLAQKHFKRSIAAVTKVQHWYRACVLGAKCRQEFLTLRCCCVFLQRCYRRRLLSNKLLCVVNEYRRYQEQRRIVAAVCIQIRWRAFYTSKDVREKFLQLRKSAIVLQRIWRANCQMRLERNYFIQLRETTIQVQQRFRANRCMAIAQTHYLQLRTCVIQLQHKRRATLHMRTIRAQYLHQREAVITIQRKLRATFAMRCQRQKFLQLRKIVRKLQERYRTRSIMRNQIKKYQHTRSCIILIQRKLRATLLMRRVRVEFISLQYYTSWMQQKYRAKRQMRLEQSEFQCLRGAAITLQRWYRGLKQIQEMRADYQRQRNKIIKIQRRFRGKLQMRRERTTFHEKRANIVRLQRWYRSIKLTRQERRRFQIIRESCICIQRKWRATLIARAQRKHFQSTVQTIVWTQQKWRATIQMRKDREAYIKMVEAACILQRHYRAHRLMLETRNQYLLIRTLVICIQRKFRAHLQRKIERYDFLLLRRYAVHLQQKFRGSLQTQMQRSEFLLLRKTVIHLQQKFRGRREMLVMRHQFLQLRRNIIDFQSRARGFLARERLKALMTPEMVEQRRRAKAARIIQRFWRGYRVRQRFENVRIRLIRRNIALLREASKANNTISNKMANAVRTLREYPNACELLHVLICLDRLSRTVPHILMDYSDYVSSFCYGIMAQTIRSEVDKQLIRYCSRIILNLARYNSTTANTFQENGLVTIAQMLLRWCDKDVEIFNTLCTLIWLFAHCPHKQQIIRNFMTTPEAIYVVRETKKLVARKERMNQNLRKPTNNSPRGLNQKTFANNALPSLEPDYGFIHNKPYTFVSSVFAFDTLLSKLEINLF